MDVFSKLTVNGTNPFVLDVKRAMADNYIKVWDVTDKNLSNRIVWKITIFIHEINKKNI